MKKCISLFLLFLLFLMSQSLMASTSVGNGGAVHDCGPDGLIQMYDLYEGAHPRLHGLRIPRDDGSTLWRRYLDEAMDKIEVFSPFLARRIQLNLDYLLLLNPDELILDIIIPRIHDADIPFHERGCDYKQIANWNERLDRVFFVKELYDRLDNLNKAALYLHEASYKVARDLYNADNSDATRKFVAETFSTSMITEGLGVIDQRLLFLEAAQARGIDLNKCKFEVRFVNLNNNEDFDFSAIRGLTQSDDFSYYISGMDSNDNVSVYNRTRSTIREFNCEEVNNLHRLNILSVLNYRRPISESSGAILNLKNRLVDKFKVQILLNGHIGYEARMTNSDIEVNVYHNDYAQVNIRRLNINFMESAARRWSEF